MIFPHRHSFYQLLYISSGAGQHVIDFEQYDVEQGSIYFLAPGKSTNGFLIIQLKALDDRFDA